MLLTKRRQQLQMQNQNLHIQFFTKIYTGGRALPVLSPRDASSWLALPCALDAMAAER